MAPVHLRRRNSLHSIASNFFLSKKSSLLTNNVYCYVFKFEIINTRKDNIIFFSYYFFCPSIFNDHLFFIQQIQYLPISF